jgi:hypothetical protein
MKRRLLAAVLVLIAVVAAPAAMWAGDRDATLALLNQRSDLLLENLAREFNELASWCDEQGLEQEAEQTRSVAGPPKDTALHLTILPREFGAAPTVGDHPKAAEWSERFGRLRAQYARDLFTLASRAFKSGQISFAYDLVRRVAELDPDHRQARSLLGYTRYRDRWVTPHEAEMLRTGHVQHDEFGWLKRGWVRRYERGERYFQGQWITADDEASRRRDWQHAWELRTDHYVIRTNYSLERGRELGQELEHLYDVFFRTFVGFFTPRQHMNVLFEGRSAGHAVRRAHPYQVRYYRTKDEYVQALQGLVGNNIEISLGLYVPTERAACFFHDEQYDDDTTLLHEATHQLFFESRLPHPTASHARYLPGHQANFWAVEGIACYMESLRREGSRLRVGGQDTERFRAARHRALKDRFYVPLEELTAMGIEDLQNSPDIRPIYSQAAGLATFFMHYDDGRYRDALVEYLRLIYAGQDTPASLSELTEANYADLDRQYLDYLRDGSP